MTLETFPTVYRLGSSESRFQSHRIRTPVYVAIRNSVEITPFLWAVVNFGRSAGNDAYALPAARRIHAGRVV